MTVAGRLATTLARGIGRAARLLPARLRRAVDERFFGAVFNVTRVTNDHYGWRPEEGPRQGETRDDGDLR